MTSDELHVIELSSVKEWVDLSGNANLGVMAKFCI